MLTERVLDFYQNQGCNCAEAMLLGARDSYRLPIPEDSLKLVSGFGGGIGCGRLCGAVAGAVAALGAMLVEGKAHDTPGFSARCAALLEAMEQALGSNQCCDLKPQYFQEGLRCQQAVEKAARVFEAFVRKAGL